MKKIIAAIMVLSLLTACKSKQVVVEEQAADEARSAKEIINGHYNNAKNFSTLYIKADVKYNDSRQSQSLTAEIRIKKDEKILISLRFLGITMAKGYITPEKVSYYEKLNGTYFEGDYEVLSRWLGTELDFYKMQNMLIGEAIYDLHKDIYKPSIEKDKYKLMSDRNGIIKEFFFEGANYLLKQQLIAQGGPEPRSLDIKYPAHTEHPKAILPAKINITAQQKDKVTINIAYNNITFDEDLSFPFSIPQGFEQIFID
jgi:hypothetical protein